MRIFITGASGFVGRNLMAHVLQRGDSVVALSRSSQASCRIRETSSALGYTVSIFEGDLTSSSPQHLSQGMKGCHIVFHSAAKVDGMGPLEPFLATNVEGTQRILAAAKQAGVPRLVHISTEALLVRDGNPIHNVNEERQLQEPPFYAPYTISKLRAEKAVVTANDPDNDFATVIVRPRSVWGKGPGGIDTAMLPALIEAVDAKSWRFFTPGYKTSSTNITNLVDGAMLAADKGRPGEIYFITDGPPTAFEDFYTRMVATQGRKMPQNWRVPTAIAWAVVSLLESIPFLAYAKSWGEETFTRQMLCLLAQEVTVDDSKARRELGYKSITVDEGLAEMRKAYESS